METRYPGAAWRPLSSSQSEPLVGTPRILVFHTMVGGLAGSEAMFRRDGYTGTESHFGVGGPWDGAALDGAVWQWQSIDRQADAQNAGNAYCTSVETADGGNPDRPWSDKQLRALVQLTTWWCRQTGAPARLVQRVTDHGIGYHSQFEAWAPDHRTCPNPTRITQLRSVVIPRVVDALSPSSPVPVIPAGNPAAVVLRRVLRHVDPMMRGRDVEAVQRKVGALADGLFGKDTAAAVRRWQTLHKLTPDGVVGPATARSFGWTFAGPVSA